MSAGIAHRVVTAAIVTNLPVALWAELTHCELAEHIDLGLLLFFSIEVAVRIGYAIRRRSFDRWLLIDAAIIGIAALPWGVLPVVRAARLAHLGRHVQHLRHVTIARAVHA